jgi:hypothetical protein
MAPFDVIRAPARLAVSVAEAALGVATDAVGALRRMLEDETPAVGQDAHGAGDAARNGSPPESRADRPQATRPATRRPPTEPPRREEHVDEGTVVVSETAEPGAEEGAGAELDVQEPWEGYDRMTGEQIIAALGQTSREALAAVELYEATTMNRRSILEAAEQRLKELTPPGARAGDRAPD